MELISTSGWRILDLGFGRALTDWEVDEVSNLYAKIENQKVEVNFRDAMLWRLIREGIFGKIMLCGNEHKRSKEFINDMGQDYNTNSKLLCLGGLVGEDHDSRQCGKEGS